MDRLSVRGAHDQSSPQSRRTTSVMETLNGAPLAVPTVYALDQGLRRPSEDGRVEVRGECQNKGVQEELKGKENLQPVSVRQGFHTRVGEEGSTRVWTPFRVSRHGRSVECSGDRSKQSRRVEE